MESGRKPVSGKDFKTIGGKSIGGKSIKKG